MNTLAETPWKPRQDRTKEVIDNLKIEDFKSSLSNNLPTSKEVNNFNKDSSHKTGKDLTIDITK